MTHPARHRGERQPARPARWMRIAPDATDLVTADAQGLTRAIVTARARGGIATRLAPVLVVGRRQPDPAGRMRASPALTGDPARRVAGRAAIRRVARGAGAGLRPGFQRMARCEACAVNARGERIGEPSRCRQCRYRRAVASGAKPFLMARLAQITGRRGARTMLAHPVAVVREVALRQKARVLEVLVAGIALPRVAGGIVAAKAGGHRRPQLAVAFRNADVASHAVAARHRPVLLVVEDQVVARLRELGERAGRGVAAQARPRVVRLGVAGHACRVVGDMQRRRRCFDSGVTLHARDTGSGMRAMRKRLRRAAR